ncbi:MULTISPECIES: sensor histidine kinase [unclassified Leifsonia]|uniref:sensor histidine kinase n=1 Tax=unclassified Leifsonia TaxID=2663824 RepID=UPI0009E94DC4|nr:MULTISPECIES: histidine kinase [unclassified Leifsonia]
MSSSTAAPTAGPGAPAVIEGVEWVRPRPDTHGYRNDAILALVLLVGSAVSLVFYRASGTYADEPWWLALLWAAGMSLPLAARRRFPEIIAVVVSIVYAAGVIGQVAELLISQIVLFISVYTVGAWGRSRLLANITRGLIVVGMFAWLFWQLIFFSAVQDYLPDLERSTDGDGFMSPYIAFGAIQIFTNLLFFWGAWYFGDSAYRAARERAALAQRTAELAGARARAEGQAVALERVRIARELHDVVAHHVSVMGVQAGAARRVVATDPRAASDALSAIEDSARSAVDELHRLLGTLRDDSLDTGAVAMTDAASTHGLAQLPALVGQAEAAGLPAAFTVIGAERPVPATVELTAYRITQEALTNARKHAGAGATADVRLRYLDDALELEVANTGLSTAAGRAHVRGGTGSGLGIIGMLERADAVGGVVEAGPRSRGGWLVRARFPLGIGVGAGAEAAASGREGGA